MKNLVFILFVLLLSACDTPCDKPSSVAGMIIGSLATVGQCNEEGGKAIAADVTKVVSGLGLCTANKAGVIASIACAPVISALGTISGNALDAKYKGCNFSNALQKPEVALIALCSQLPF